MLRSVIGIVLGSAMGAGLTRGENINWFSDAGKTNLDSSGAAMNAGFRFELGVFDGGFVPNAGNLAEWASHWQPVQRVSYNPSTSRFAAVFTVSGNPPPFISGATAYVWGFRGSPSSSEWILFRHGDWEWPVPNPLSPFPLEWNASAATPVIGEILASGSPFLMKSAAVTNAAPPTTIWVQWRADQLAGEPLDEPGDDPDDDGSPNLLEFVFGTDPRVANAPVATPVALVSGHVQITIPRRIDHPATLVVEVSGDLANWQSGPAHTETVSNTVTSLVVRDLTPFGGANPKRFLRLRAVLP